MVWLNVAVQGISTATYVFLDGHHILLAFTRMKQGYHHLGWTFPCASVDHDQSWAKDFILKSGVSSKSNSIVVYHSCSL